MLSDIACDLRVGVRVIRRNAVFAAFVLLTLGFTIGANTAVFALVKTLWLEARPVADPDRMVIVVTRYSPTRVEDYVPSDQFDVLRLEPVFEGIAGQVFDVNEEGRPRPQVVGLDGSIEFLPVTSNYFQVLGLQVRGRDFTEADDTRGAPAVAIISDHLWRTVFRGRSDTLGLTLETDQEPVTIIGIAPAGFRGARLGERVDVWISRAPAARMTALALTTGLVVARRPPVVALARLRPGITLEEATTGISHLEGGRYRLLPLASAVGLPGRATMRLDEGRVLFLTSAMALLTMLAGCATLATLVLVHLERRRREMTVRLALGCGRGGLIRAVLVELAVLAVGGVMLALVVAAWTLAISRTLSLPGGLSLDRLDLAMDWTVVSFGFLLGAGTIFGAGVVALWSFGRSSSGGSLVNAASTASTSSLGLRRGLLALHVAATIVVLVGGALLVRTMRFAVAEGTGFDVAHTLFVSVEPSRAEFYDPVTNPRYWDSDGPRYAAYERLVSEVRSLPDVRAVALGEAPIRVDGFGGLIRYGIGVIPMAFDTPDGPRQLVVGSLRGGPGWVEALGISVVAGRSASIEANDRLVTRSLAERVWPNGTAVGQYLTQRDDPASPFDETALYRVVGVVEDFVHGSMSRVTDGGLITTDLSVESFGTAGISLVARTRSDPAPLVPLVEQISRRIFPWANRSRVATGQQLLYADLGRQRLGAQFFAGFGVVSLFLGFTGVFGLVAYLAESRSRELGVRLALGATRTRLVRDIVWMGLLPVAAGSLVGVLGAALLSDAMAAFLYGVGTLDAVSYMGTVAVMVGGALTASLLAVLRIRWLSPMDALRTE